MPRKKKVVAAADVPVTPAGPKVKLTEEVLDKIEDRLLRSMTGEGDLLDASTMKELRVILKENGRLVMPFKQGEESPWNDESEKRFREALGECRPDGRVIQ